MNADTPQGICDDCGRIVREANRPLVQVHAEPGTPKALLAMLTQALLAAAGLRVCRTCGTAAKL